MATNIKVMKERLMEFNRLKMQISYINKRSKAIVERCKEVEEELGFYDQKCKYASKIIQEFYDEKAKAQKDTAIVQKTDDKESSHEGNSESVLQ